MSPERFHAEYADHLRAQRRMLASMQSFCRRDAPGAGLMTPHGRSPDGVAINVGERFDRHALGLLCCFEVETRDPR